MASSDSIMFKRGYGAAAVFLLAGAGCMDPGREVHEVPPGIAFEDLRFRSYRGSRLAVAGEAARASLRRDNSDVEAEHLRVRLPGQRAEPEVLVQAPAGAGSLRMRRFEASGGIVGTRAADTFRTERAVYDQADGLVRGDRPVTLQGEGYTFEGPGFTIDPAEGRVRVEGGARLTWRARLGR
jgi:hypothetical protein